MNKIFEINENILGSAKHLIRTENGLIQVYNLKIGDVIIGTKDTSKITKIIECGKKPDAPIIGETNKLK